MGVPTKSRGRALVRIEFFKENIALWPNGSTTYAARRLEWSARARPALSEAGTVKSRNLTPLIGDCTMARQEDRTSPRRQRARHRTPCALRRAGIDLEDSGGPQNRRRVVPGSRPSPAFGR